MTKRTDVQIFDLITSSLHTARSDFDPLHILVPKTTIKELGLDDAASLVFLQSLEKGLGAKLPGDALRRDRTVGDLIATIRPAPGADDIKKTIDLITSSLHTARPDFDRRHILVPKTTIKELGLDGAASLAFLQSLEKGLGAKLPGDPLDPDRTVGDLVATIRRAPGADDIKT